MAIPQTRSQAVGHNSWLVSLLAVLTLCGSLCGFSPARAEAEAAPPVVPSSSPGVKVVIALGGGGTRGCAHIGVLRVLQREGIPIDGIAGTSMGAIVGGLFCAGTSVNEIENRMLNKSLLHAFHTVPIPLRVAVIPIFFIPHVFGHHPYDGLYRGNRFRNYLNNSVPECEREIRDLEIPFCAVATNLLDGKPYAIKSGNLGQAIQASSAVPVLRRPVPIGDELFVDGGLLANLPAKQARAMGADIVIGVDVDETFERLPPAVFRKIGSVSHRTISLLLSKVDESQVLESDVLIQPRVNGIKLLSTDLKDAERAIAEGEKAAQLAIPAIRAKIESVRANR